MKLHSKIIPLLVTVSVSMTTSFTLGKNNLSSFGSIGGKNHENLCMSSSTDTNVFSKDTASELPVFENKESYEDYLMEASGLPKGFATGSAKGSFVSEEAPSMGKLPIKGTVIYLEDGPTDSWAAVFTKNKVSFEFSNDL